MRVIFAATLFGGLGLLTLDVWPGMIENVVFAFPFGCAWLPLFGVWFLLLNGLALRNLVTWPESPARRRWWGVRSAGVMYVTLGLLWLHVPERIIFSLYSSEFQEVAKQAPNGEELNWNVGPYRVDRYATDERGGVFFRTAVGPDGIGPDQMSYGFTLRPNMDGSPFGDAKYRLNHMFGDWYVFGVSDDS